MICPTCGKAQLTERPHVHRTTPPEARLLRQLVNGILGYGKQEPDDYKVALAEARAFLAAPAAAPAPAAEGLRAALEAAVEALWFASGALIGSNTEPQVKRAAVAGQAIVDALDQEAIDHAAGGGLPDASGEASDLTNLPAAAVFAAAYAASGEGGHLAPGHTSPYHDCKPCHAAAGEGEG